MYVRRLFAELTNFIRHRHVARFQIRHRDTVGVFHDHARKLCILEPRLVQRYIRLPLDNLVHYGRYWSLVAPLDCQVNQNRALKYSKAR
jgi:hypothetical protein